VSIRARAQLQNKDIEKLTRDLTLAHNNNAMYRHKCHQEWKQKTGGVLFYVDN